MTTEYTPQTPFIHVAGRHKVVIKIAGELEDIEKVRRNFLEFADSQGWAQLFENGPAQREGSRAHVMAIGVGRPDAGSQQ